MRALFAVLALLAGLLLFRPATAMAAELADDGPPELTQGPAANDGTVTISGHRIRRAQLAVATSALASMGLIAVAGMLAVVMAGGFWGILVGDRLGMPMKPTWLDYTVTSILGIVGLAVWTALFAVVGSVVGTAFGAAGAEVLGLFDENPRILGHLSLPPLSGLMAGAFAGALGMSSGLVLFVLLPDRFFAPRYPFGCRTCNRVLVEERSVAAPTPPWLAIVPAVVVSTVAAGLALALTHLSSGAVRWVASE